MSQFALAGCSEVGIATLTGHALTNVRSILNSHCLDRDPALAHAAIRKFETSAQNPDRLPDKGQTFQDSKK